MNTRRLATVCALGLLLGTGLFSWAASSGPRQYYSNWSYNSQKNYHYRSYYYKPSADYGGYRHHYVIYNQTYPRYTHYYNPYSKKYWGRCPTTYTPGQPQYSLLAPQDQRPTLEEIPDKAFPTPGPMPVIPEAKDRVLMEAAPDDLPTIQLPK